MEIGLEMNGKYVLEWEIVCEWDSMCEVVVRIGWEWGCMWVVVMQIGWECDVYVCIGSGDWLGMGKCVVSGSAEC